MAKPTANGHSSHIGIIDGLRAFLGGISFVIGTPLVWGYAAVPIGIVLLLTCCFGVVGFVGAAQLSSTLMGETKEGWTQAGSWLLTVSLTLVIFVIGIFLAVVLAQPLSSFAMEAIVRAQEKALGGPPLPEQPFFLALLHGLRISLVVAAFGISVSLLFFLVDLVFPPATVVTGPLQFLVVGGLLAWNFLDYPLGMRGLGIQQRLRWMRLRRGAVLAFGLAWAVVLLIPGVSLLLLPMGVAGAARLVVMGGGTDEIPAS